MFLQHRKKSIQIRYMPGVGARREALLNKLNICDTLDLIYHFPKGYEDRGNMKSVSELSDGDVTSVVVKIGSDGRSTRLPGAKNRTMTKFEAFDDSGSMTVTFFNQPYITKSVIRGHTYRLFGKVSRKGRYISMASPKFEPWNDTDSAGISYGEKRFYPVYGLTSGISMAFMRELTQNLFDKYASHELDKSYLEFLPKSLIEKKGFVSEYEALRCLHFPKSEDEIKKAKERLIYDELFLFAMQILTDKKNNLSTSKPALHAISMDRFKRCYSFEFTKAQNRVIADITRDMCINESAPMYRLVSGDVGSGKTVCAAAGVFIALENSCQAAMMVPTEILARQHYEEFKSVFESLGYSVALLVGSLTKREKDNVKRGLASGEIDFVVGTHALIEDNVQFSNLALVVTDEQHRFGVKQREALGNKTKGVNVLVMSATPIPRTLALILYGDLDVSGIDEMPKGRKKVSTHVVDESYRERMFSFVKKQCDEGNRVYIVCPAIEDEIEIERGSVFRPLAFGEHDKSSSGTKLKAVNEYEELIKKYIPDVQMGILHGKMKGSEKDRVMQDFVSGKISVLVSTTVIEVGVNVPDATLMIVENAERFGLSQLHQLRGRVGRGNKKSWCILVSDTKSKVSQDRLNAMCTNYNGFDIAKIDLEQRGPGDFFKNLSIKTAARRNSDSRIEQHGEIKFRIAGISEDVNVLHSAFNDAKAILASDENLLSEENQSLRRILFES